MMRPTGKVLVLLLSLTLVVPATVLAQSAGDEQYVDPFQGSGGGGGGGNGSEGGSDNGSTPTTTTPSDTATGTVESTTAESGDGTLPRTGFSLLPVTLTGLFLLGAGLAVRRGARLPSAAVPGYVPATAVPGSGPATRGIIPDAGSATAPRAGLPLVGLGLVGLFILGGLLRRRA
jgi:hypothetical protein